LTAPSEDNIFVASSALSGKNLTFRTDRTIPIPSRLSGETWIVPFAKGTMFPPMVRCSWEMNDWEVNITAYLN
jgi:hypothetical protein